MPTTTLTQEMSQLSDFLRSPELGIDNTGFDLGIQLQSLFSETLKDAASKAVHTHRRMVLLPTTLAQMEFTKYLKAIL